MNLYMNKNKTASGLEYIKCIYFHEFITIITAGIKFGEILSQL